MEAILTAHRFTKKLQNATLHKSLKRNRTAKLLENKEGLYRNVLYCCFIPVLDAPPSMVSNPSESSVVGDALYTTLEVLDQFRKKIEKRIDLGLDRCFTAVGTGLLRHAQYNAFVDVKLLVKEICKLAIWFYDDQDMEEEKKVADLMPVVKMYLAILEACIRDIEGNSPVLRHALFREGLLKMVRSCIVSYGTIHSNAELFDYVQQLFQMGRTQHLKNGRMVADIMNERKVLASLKIHLAELNRDACLGFMSHDFPSQEAYQVYKLSMIQQLQGLHLAFSALYGVKVTDDYSSTLKLPGLPSKPEEAEAWYKRILMLCLENDYMDQMFEKSQLSKLSKSVLAECALRWRISSEFREICLFESLIERYEMGSLALRQLKSPLNDVRKLSDRLTGKMRSSDSKRLLRVYDLLDQNMMKQVHEFVVNIHRKSFNIEELEEVARLCNEFIQTIRQDPIWIQNASNTEDIKQQLIRTIETAAMERMNHVTQSLEIDTPSQQDYLTRLKEFMEILSGDLNKYQTCFSLAFLDSVYIDATVAKGYVKNASLYIENVKFLGLDAPIGEMFDLYEHTREFYAKCADEFNIE